MKRSLLAVMLGAALALASLATTFASPSPNGPGQPGATCGSADALMTPGNAVGASGSAFNPDGTAGSVYAGSPGTDSLEHANSSHAVSQYDVACFQVSSN